MTDLAVLTTVLTVGKKLGKKINPILVPGREILLKFSFRVGRSRLLRKRFEVLLVPT